MIPPATLRSLSEMSWFQETRREDLSPVDALVEDVDEASDHVVVKIGPYLIETLIRGKVDGAPSGCDTRDSCWEKYRRKHRTRGNTVLTRVRLTLSLLATGTILSVSFFVVFVQYLYASVPRFTVTPQHGFSNSRCDLF